jgi:hypothetical protein
MRAAFGDEVVRVGGLGVQGIGGDERPKDVDRVEKF